jgi:hypothetical protein
VKRWIDNGVLRPTGAAEGIDGYEAVTSFAVLDQGVPFVELDQLVSGARQQRRSSVRSTLLRALRQGEPHDIRRLLLGEYQSGSSVATIADTLIDCTHNGVDWALVCRRSPRHGRGASRDPSVCRRALRAQGR